LGHRNQDRTDVKVQMFKINTETTWKQPLQWETSMVYSVVKRFTCKQIHVIYLNWKKDK
jgi:hypothetical protein